MADLKVQSTPEQNPDCLVLKLDGNLDLFTFGELKKVFDALPEDKASLKVAVDLSGVAYVASSGWGVLMSRAKVQKLKGGALVIFGMNAGNKNVYDTLHVGSIMAAAEDLKQAKEIFKKK